MAVRSHITRHSETRPDANACRYGRSCMLMALVVLFMLTGCRDHPGSGQYSTATAEKGVALAQEVVPSDISLSRETAITRAVRKVSDSVVGINVVQIRINRRRSIFDDDPFFRQFFPSIPYRERIKSLGSGFIIDQEGHVLTNQHVVNQAEEITITLTDGTEHVGDIVGMDEISDIALLKIRDPKNLVPVEFGHAGDLVIGEWVIAFGNPFGLFDLNAKPTVTVGVISSLDQDFGKLNQRVYKDMIQTDAAINQGNSGGPLVNALGQVIGMNTFIFSGETGGSIGLGFAIPVDRLLSIVDELKKHGRVDRNIRTGIQADDLTPRVARFLGLRSTNGAIITSIYPGSPADRAGLKVYDVIIEVAGKRIRNTNDILSELEALDVRTGEKLQLKVFRQGTLFDVTLNL